MALVAHEGPALVQSGPALGKPYILSFGKTQYLVPASAIKSPAKKSNTVPNGRVLGQILATKAPEKWLDYCSPECLCHIEADDSTCVYTTFTVEGHEDESRFLRFISGTIADRNFPIWRERVDKKIEDGEIVLKNDRQRARLEVLNWSKTKDCPGRAQLNPEISKWVALEKEESVKSCRVEPEAKKRQLKSHGTSVLSGGISKSGTHHHALGAKAAGHQLLVDDVTDWEICYRLGPRGTYSVSEVGDVLRIVQYKHTNGVVNAQAATTTPNNEAAGSAAEPAANANGNHLADDEEEEEDTDL